MLFCPKCQQLEPTSPQRHDDGSVTYLCKKCGSAIPLRRDLKPGEIVAGFEIEGELGRGAMGIVYQARQTNLDREVAIKILSDDSASDEVYVERFFREARAAASLSHPNVVQAYDAGVTNDGIYYFVMEKVTGENLELVLNNVGPLNIPQALDIFISVAGALSYAWTRNQLSHGDIKPENIIMRLNGKVKLADFGLARRAKDPELADEDIRATPAYAPPEIIQGDKSVPGFKSDMYSFGASAYHILIGHEPFVGTDPMKVCSMQISDIQTPLSKLNPDIPQRLSDLIDALMEKDPAKRPETWDKVVTELKDIRDEFQEKHARDDASGLESGPLSEDRSSKKFLFIIPAAAIALLAITAIALVFFRQTGYWSQMQGKLPFAGKQISDPAGSSSASTAHGDIPQVRDAAYFRNRWAAIRDYAGQEGPALEQLERFIEEAGAEAPADAVKMLADLRTKRDAARQVQSKALILRNELLDQAAGFNQEELSKLDFDRLDSLLQSVRLKLDELKRIDGTLEEPIFMPEQRKTIDLYIKKLANLQLSKSLGGTVSSDIEQKTGTEPFSGEIKDTADGNTVETAATTPGKEVKKNKYYLLLMDSLPDMIESEAARNQGLNILNDLLADKTFKDKEQRKQCVDIRKFLLLNQMPILQYLTANKETLHNMTLFPHAYPDNVLDDIVRNTFYLVVPGSRKGRVGVAWNQIRKNEGEEQIIVTLINSSQLSKLSQDFREYLYVRALFLGVDPSVLGKRFARASGLSPEKINDLNRIAKYFEPREDGGDAL